MQTFLLSLKNDMALVALIVASAISTAGLLAMLVMLPT